MGLSNTKAVFVACALVLSARPTPGAPTPVAPPTPIPTPSTHRADLQGSWRVVSIGEEGKATLTDPDDPWFIEFRGGTLLVPYRTGTGWKTRAYKFAIDGVNNIDLITPSDPVGRGIYKLTGNELRLAVAATGDRPATFGGKGVIVFEMARVTARTAEEEGESELKRLGEEADGLAAKLTTPGSGAYRAAVFARLMANQASRLKLITAAQLKDARKELRNATERVANALTAAAEKKAAQVFTIDIDLPPRKTTIEVNATGKERRVLEELRSAVDGLNGRAGGLTVSIFRKGDAREYPVDLVGIIKNADPLHNYVLAPGDRLRVRAKGPK